MMWKKEFSSEQGKSFDYVLAALGVFVITGVIFNNRSAFIGVGMFIAFLIAYKIYDRSMEKKIALHNQATTIKLFPGEEAILRFELQNSSIFPMLNGKLNLRIGSAVNAYTMTEDPINYWKELKISLSIFQKKATAIQFPVIAEQRGVSKITNISLELPHFLSFHLITLKYNPSYQTEFIVFPKLLPVRGVEIISQIVPGSARLNLSPFEDIQSPLGTREYNYSDPFYRINWNASVKSQTLQTNVYEKVVDKSFVFIVNIGSEDNVNMAKFNENLENLLSYTAYLCEYATKSGVSYEIYMNARKSGKVPYVHFPEGGGKTHYGHTLEMLARIHKQSLIVPFNEMIHRLGKQFASPKTMIVIGDVPTGAMQIMDRWKRSQKTVYHVVEAKDGAVVRPLVKEAMMDAN